MLAVTTFPEWGWDVYARKCLESWIGCWPGSILAYYEGKAPPALAGIEFRPLSALRNRTEFLAKAPKTNGSFLHDARRFCHKVFAQLDAMDDHSQFWWIDADVEMTSTLPEELVREITDEGFVSFLGRNSYTETGVIAFNQDFEEFSEFRQKYRQCYEAMLIFTQPYWTDCHAFDFARAGGGNNLTPQGKGFDNVLRQSALGPYMVHHKGKLKLQMEERHAV